MKWSRIQKMILTEVLLIGVCLAAGYRQSVPSASASVRTAVRTDTESNQLFEETGQEPESEKKDFIKWVDFNVTCEAMDDAYRCDLDTHGHDIELHWIELLAILAAKNGGDFNSYRTSEMDALAEKILSGEETVETLTENMKYYPYYLEAYTAVLGGMVGDYEIQVTGSDDTPTAALPEWEHRYGLKAFLPIAKNFPYSDYDDFGVSRSYGYARRHLGHDMMGQVGTPVIAVESGYVEAMGWNQYGGWRLGIRSFDGKRYYYYAHLRQNFPYCKELEVGSVVTAGDVIGYLGRTGYSAKENTNNIDTPHLHFGLQLIFDESQKEGNGEIWIDCYQLIRFLYRNRSETIKNTDTKEWHRVIDMSDPAAERYCQEHGIKKKPKTAQQTKPESSSENAS